MRAALERLAPGTPLRDGLDRILRGRTGALIVIGHGEAVQEICDGGFELDSPFTPTRLRELCKMDGAVVLSADGSRIRRANVQLMPDSALPTEESGTRHRSAERAALQTGMPVIAVSQSMNIITVYAAGERHLLRSSSELLSRANQLLNTAERYRERLDSDLDALDFSEIGDFAAVSDIISALQDVERLRRVAAAIENDVVELGSDGHQLDLQLQEITGDTQAIRRLLVADYLVSASGLPTTEDINAALESLRALSDPALLKQQEVATILGFPSDQEALAAKVTPRGYRVLSRIPRLQFALMSTIISNYVTLPSLLRATTEELAEVETVGPLWAKHIRSGLDRLAE